MVPNSIAAMGTRILASCPLSSCIAIRITRVCKQFLIFFALIRFNQIINCKLAQTAGPVMRRPNSFLTMRILYAANNQNYYFHYFKSKQINKQNNNGIFCSYSATGNHHRTLVMRLVDLSSLFRNKLSGYELWKLGTANRISTSEVPCVAWSVNGYLYDFLFIKTIRFNFRIPIHARTHISDSNLAVSTCQPLCVCLCAHQHFNVWSTPKQTPFTPNTTNPQNPFPFNLATWYRLVP